MDILSCEGDAVMEIDQNKIQVKKLYEEIENCLKGREKLIIYLYILWS